jgi:hypothetical protein
VNWKAKCRAVVDNLRLTVAQHPADLQLAELLGSLSMASPQFAALWSDQRVHPCASAIHQRRHHRVGELAVTQQIACRRLTGATPDQNTVAAGLRSFQALRLLAPTRGLRQPRAKQ